MWGGPGRMLETRVAMNWKGWRVDSLAYATGYDGIGGGAMMDDPIAFFLTWPTYGTWLPGDERGWILHQRGWKLPDPVRLLEAEARMTEDACLLSPEARRVVQTQVAETSRFRGWTLLAVNCRSNHLHAVVSAPAASPKKIRADLKAWCTRRLREKIDAARENWWADRGSIRWVFTEAELESVLRYVIEAQDRKGLNSPSQPAA
jgi:REP element-mobilizing transposase RayT